MPSLPVLREQALGLPAPERMQLAAELLGSFPAVLEDPDEGLAEALRRDQELAEKPEVGLSWTEVKGSPS